MTTVLASPLDLPESSLEAGDEIVHWRDSAALGDAGVSAVPVVLLHPVSADSRIWRHQWPALVAAGYRVVAIDHISAARGHGGSTLRIRRVLDTLGISRCHMLGAAGGGGAAFEFALAFESYLISLVVSNSVGNVRDADYVAIGRALRPEGWHALPVEFQELGPAYRAAHPAGVAQWRTLSHDLHTVPARAKLPPGEPPTYEANMSVTWAGLEQLRVPMLIMTGDADLYLPPPLLRSFGAHLPQSRLHILRECGHAGHWECAEEFNRVVLDFLASHSSVTECAT